MAYLHQLGIAEESTYGTYATPTRFYEILPGESLGLDTTTINSAGLRPNRRVASGVRRQLVRKDPRGSVSMEVPVAGFGVWLKHALGTVATSQPDAGGAPTVYDHTFTIGDLSGLGLTIQKGVERTDGTVEPFAVLGGKVASWSLGVAADEFAVAEFTVEGTDIDDTSGLATASYTDPALLTFAQGSLEVDDVAVAVVKNASVGTTADMNLDRRFLGSGLIKSEPNEQAFRVIEGTLVAEFDNPATFWDRYNADTSAKLELLFTGATIESTYSYQLNVTIPDCRFGGQLPQITDEDVPDITVPYVGLDDGTNEPITVLYRTTDATP